MCWHRRVIFSCNHFQWGAEVHSCVVQKLYISGEWTESCETMNSHPLHSLTVQTMCKKCERKTAKLEGTMSRTKLLMKDLNESLTRLKREVKRKDVVEALADVETLALWIPVSPVEEYHEKWLCSPIDFIERSQAKEAGGK
jgi:hypothetical protein